MFQLPVADFRRSRNRVQGFTAISQTVRLQFVGSISGALHVFVIVRDFGEHSGLLLKTDNARG
jgi:hypothetical protein